MKIKLAVLAVILLLGAGYSKGQGILYQLSPPAPNAQVLVCPSPDNGYPCPAPAAIFSNVGLTTPVSQPVQLGSSGFFSFYIASGTYTIQLLGPGYNSGNRQVVSIGSSSGGGIPAVSSLPGSPAPNLMYQLPNGNTYCTGPTGSYQPCPGTFFTRFMGPSPLDPKYGGFGDFKACYDLNVSGQPTSIITSSSTKTLTASNRTSNVITYTFSNVNGVTIPLITPGQSITVTGSNNTNGALNVVNLPVLSATGANLTVASVGANVANAADTGTVTTTVGCMNFNASRDVGKILEVKGVGASGALATSTITSVQSPLQATITGSFATNATLQKGWSCHDDTTALQSWVTDINNGIPVDSPLSGGIILNHAGYVPGLFCTTKPLRFINPLGNAGFCGNCGFGTPEPFNGANAGESLSLWGSGVYRSGFVTLSTYNFTANPTLNDGPLYMLNWNGSQILNIAVLAPDPSIVYSTSGNTGINCGWITDASSHNTFIGWQVENFNNGGTLPGFCVLDTDYGSNYENFQLYGNNYNIYLKAPPASSSISWADVHFRGGQLFSPTGTAGSGGNMILDGGGGSQPYSNFGVSDTAFSNNCDGNNGSNGISEIAVRSGVTVSDNFTISNSRICDASTANGFGVTVLTGAVSGEIDLSNTWIGQSSGTSNAAFSPFFIQPTGWAIKMFGGSLNKGSTNLTNLGTVPTSSRIFINGTANNTGATAFAGTGATSGVWTCFETAANCGGQGGFTSSTYATFTNCASSGGTCGSSSAGAVSIAAAATTVTVATTAVTANSQILISEDSTLGTRLSVTCNTTTGRTYSVSTRTAGTSFVITASAAPATNPACLNYTIVN
jgi:hypothetical protein